MDTLIKGELGKEAMDADKRLMTSKLHVGCCYRPLIAALEELTISEEPNDNFLVAAMQHSLMMIGNASAQFSKERRIRALEKLNPDLKSLAEDEDLSYLFGRG